ncbi:BREX system Lon protease-like protein BrxL [Mesorhizobium sp. M6A.T.Cr.TU.017.01.1.1]|uniref:BREX system Lon protease-like protein BrxL n=1 Tax=Mesorhizobium sp. M6A.T.Cr.TU.017.01.1.1 TaxID=2496774 RepID=UPI000FD46DB6|nr:BREX system Lon protease-like protein BrxL [Mesorhizobium sp. M6A.T.Cr.TU.017.01.1.1]RUU97103.1 BREX system Lon protease-like protein BrxL [Mesorhizobium sp. M6A.T.Cr.TU.017.01.1.1]
MNELDTKINAAFPGLVVRKDLVKAVKGNAIVPTYVLEYLLGQYCATSDEASIQSGIETVKEILRKHYVHRNEAGLVRSNVREKGRYKVIDKISVALNDKNDAYEAEFANLGIKKVVVDSGTVKSHPKLLVAGVWCIADVEYEHTEDKAVSPWILGTLKPIQLSHFDYEAYLKARQEFTTYEWIDLLIQSIGFDPEMFGKRSKLIQLMRLIPFVERNYNLIELGPKGTGKSHIYSEFSPHGILISGGEVTVPKLFVNNQSGKLGLVGYWDVVAFDEFAGRQKRVDKSLVDIMKNYMANKTFSRGVETLGAEASMVFVGNTKHNVPYMLKHTDLFEEVPEKYYDSAFIDRLHAYIPGWEVDVIRGEMFSNGYGFVVDYLAEILRHLRSDDYSDRYKDLFRLSSAISTRDRDGINKTFSGLMKILFPGGGASPDEIEELLRLSIEGRKRVKDQLMRIDTTYPAIDFSYFAEGERKLAVTTLEEDEYPTYYHRRGSTAAQPGDPTDVRKDAPSGNSVSSASKAEGDLDGAREGHRVFSENQKGISFDLLFGSYVKGAGKITVTDPYIRLFYQVRNLMEFIETVVKHKAPEDEVDVHLVTARDDLKADQQKANLLSIEESCLGSGVNFTWEFDATGTIHARHIVTDTGWKISLDRGLDIFQHYEMNDAFSLSNRLQQFRSAKAFEVTYMREARANKL